MSNLPVLGYRMLTLIIVRSSASLHHVGLAVAHHDATHFDQGFTGWPDLVAELRPRGTRRVQALPIHHVYPLAVVGFRQATEAEAGLHLDPVVDLLIGLEPVGSGL